MRNFEWVLSMGRLLAVFVLGCVAWLAIDQDGLRADEPAGPVKVFVLAGQSNMEGQAVVDLTGKDYNQGRGTLASLMEDPQKQQLVQHLRNAEGKWVQRDDVWIYYERDKGPLLKGRLGIGYSVYGDSHHFGPELEFGHVLGNSLSSPVLLIKTAWGGKSLYRDFRPPSSGGAVGENYQRMLLQVDETLKNLGALFPELQGRQVELAGLVWYQGWNDGVEPKLAVPEYESNLANLIRDVRAHWKTPQLPVVIGELTGPWVEAPGAWQTLRQAQAAVARQPEFVGNVAFVETHDFVRAAEDSPNPGHGHHEFGNAETYLLVGRALGEGMEKLLKQQSDRSTKKMSQTHRELTLEGWRVLVDKRLDEPQHSELLRRSLRFLEAKLFDITMVVPGKRLQQLRQIKLVLDLECGDLGSMQYHPSAEWLKGHGYSPELAKCVHVPKIADLATPRNIREQPWVILHELAHAYHDQFLGFDDPRVIRAFEGYCAGKRGEACMLYDGRRVKHYGLTNEKEFFAEMTESFFGFNDFYPFQRGELKEAEPDVFALMKQIWMEKGAD